MFYDCGWCLAWFVDTCLLVIVLELVFFYFDFIVFM